MKRPEMRAPVKHYLHPPSVVVREKESVAEALASLRCQDCKGKILYFYVVDGEGCLKGIVPTRALLLSEPQRLVQEIMEEAIFCLHEEDTLGHAVESLSKHRLLALPVVDDAHHLKGVVDIQMCLEEDIDLFKEQRNQDVFQLVGMTLEEAHHRSPWHSYRSRMPWILCNMFGGVACAIVSSIYRVVLGKVLILAMFIPLVLSLSESISMQSMTQSFQILRRQHMSMRRILWQMLGEIRVALLMALTSGVLVGLISLFWESPWQASGAIALGIFFSVTFSSVLGASIPMVLHAKKLDPKVASGPVVLTIADIITTGIYLSLASFWLL